MIFYGGEKSQEIFFKLKADEFFGAHVAKAFGTARIILIPGVVDGLSEEIYPSSIGYGEI